MQVLGELSIFKIVTCMAPSVVTGPGQSQSLGVWTVTHEACMEKSQSRGHGASYWFWEFPIKGWMFLRQSEMQSPGKSYSRTRILALWEAKVSENAQGDSSLFQKHCLTMVVSRPLLTMVDLSQDSQGMPEATDSTEPYIQFFFFLWAMHCCIVPGLIYPSLALGAIFEIL